MQINAIGTYSATQPLKSMAISRRDPGPHDVQIAIDYCGVCHSDLHQARSEWAGTLYPCVPGHEIVGQVTAIGNQVSGSTLATWSASAVWSTAVNSVRSARQDWKTTATI
jgi:uncharacterized zinc-type alcohol dehydrogenase-like protein